MTSSPRKTKSTATVNFSDRARKHGLHLQGVSLASISLLAQIQSEPLPVINRSRGKGSQVAAGGPPLASPGPLIRHELVRLNGAHYVTTPKGDEYLTKMKGVGLL